VELLRGEADALIVPTLVLVEAGYLVAKALGASAEASLLRAAAGGDFRLEPLTREDLARMADLVEKYADLPLGTVDASLVAVAERLGVSRIATLDRRHFSVVRPDHVDAFTLLP
jgi:predicted nucleic acid-binding protein